jgi:hypothetical protein
MDSATKEGSDEIKLVSTEYTQTSKESELFQRGKYETSQYRENQKSAKNRQVERKRIFKRDT